MKTLSTSLSLALAYLREKPLATILNILLLGLGVGTIIALALTLAQLEEGMDRDAAGIDLVIGAKGSPLQLILSTVFHIDIPTGNVPVSDAAAVIASPMVKQAIPLALGDSYKTFRIVGTNAAYVQLYGASVLSGRMWNAPQEAVIGAEVARVTGLVAGMTFTGSHGLTEGGSGHADHPYTVVGVLKPAGSVIDRVILTAIESVWQVHGHADAANSVSAVAEKLAKDHDHDHRQADKDEGKEVTAYLIQYATPLAAASFPRRVNAGSTLQAAAPALEVARLFNLLGVGIAALKVFALVMMLCAALGIFVGLTNALNERRADLALLRLLGASPAMVFLTVLTQGIALGVAGVILGLLIGHAGTEWIGATLEKTHRIALTGFTLIREEFWIAAGAFGLALLAGVFPAWRAYRSAVPVLLSRT
ncbi:MAG: ABC transporter permease [Burkholderiales bacterium]|nr:ABC transporter permease [Burkholderiales bacterium]